MTELRPNAEQFWKKPVGVCKRLETGITSLNINIKPIEWFKTKPIQVLEKSRPKPNQEFVE